MNRLSGKFVLRLSPELHLQLKQRSAQERLSLNELCVKFIAEGFKSSNRAESSLLALPPLFLRIIRKKWKKSLVGIVLFGSTARGEASERSDIDLLVVLEPESKVQRSLYLEWDDAFQNWPSKELARYSPQFVRLPSAKNASGLWFEIALDGKIIFEKDARLSSLLRDLKTLMAEGKVIRKLAHGQPYWKSSQGNMT
jgi:predicted nucleotidyltransferase